MIRWWEAARIQQRFDISLMSTKGMSIVAARKLIDWLTAQGVKIHVVHDFDISGFSIYGTLAAHWRVGRPIYRWAVEHQDWR